MEGVRSWWDVGWELSVPGAILRKIDAECSSGDERISALASYVVTTIPSITWEDIAGVLFSEDETRAVERVKPYIQKYDGRHMYHTYGSRCIPVQGLAR